MAGSGIRGDIAIDDVTFDSKPCDGNTGKIHYRKSVSVSQCR